jgi:hypothetical protein
MSEVSIGAPCSTAVGGGVAVVPGPLVGSISKTLGVIEADGDDC